jgi:hypothetical protein
MTDHCSSPAHSVNAAAPLNASQYNNCPEGNWNQPDSNGVECRLFMDNRHAVHQWHWSHSTVWCRRNALGFCSANTRFRSWEDTGYPDRSYSWFSSVPPGKCRNTISIRQGPLSFKFFTVPPFVSSPTIRRYSLDNDSVFKQLIK